jgi:hypothetical protein
MNVAIIQHCGIFLNFVQIVIKLFVDKTVVFYCDVIMGTYLNWDDCN